MGMVFCFRPLEQNKFHTCLLNCSDHLLAMDNHLSWTSWSPCEVEVDHRDPCPLTWGLEHVTIRCSYSPNNLYLVFNRGSKSVNLVVIVLKLLKHVNSAEYKDTYVYSSDQMEQVSCVGVLHYEQGDLAS